jgi:hypothetical protein
MSSYGLDVGQGVGFCGIRNDGYKIPKEVMINESGLVFTDISSEAFRVYEFSNGKEVRIDEPLRLNVSPSGGHRLFDAGGTSHYIPKGWVHLRWKVKQGCPNFVK